MKARRTALAVLSLLAIPRAAFGHDPLEATATARAESDRFVLEVRLGSRRAFRACGRERFEGCARTLYRVEAGGRALEPRSSSAALRPDGDLDLTVVYPPPGPGPLRLTALHLLRSPDEMAGASLAVYDGEALLARRMLAAEDASLEVRLEGPPAERLWRAGGKAAGLVILFALMAACAIRLGWARGRRPVDCR